MLGSCTARPASPVCSQSAFTDTSEIRNGPPVYMRRADIGASLQAYEQLLSATKAYTSTMLAMSKASSDVAQALEDCSRLKGAQRDGAAFQAACGWHYLASNYSQVLCDTFWKEVSIPLLSQLDTYRATVRERQLVHEKAIVEKSRLLRSIESRYRREEHRHQRDLSSFRHMLDELQEKADELEVLKVQHYTDALEYEEQTWDYVAAKVGLLVRSQMEVAERLSSKATSDPVLEGIVAAIPDPFHSYGPPKREDELFSILQPTPFTNSTLPVSEEPTTPSCGPARSAPKSRRDSANESRDDATPTAARGDAAGAAAEPCDVFPDKPGSRATPSPPCAPAETSASAATAAGRECPSASEQHATLPTNTAVPCSPRPALFAGESPKDAAAAPAAAAGSGRSHLTGRLHAQASYGSLFGLKDEHTKRFPGADSPRSPGTDSGGGAGAAQLDDSTTAALEGAEVAMCGGKTRDRSRAEVT
ncbi:hypothetical protein MSPP1_002971 [Malassezia sp. CBS 17886]|nr:hypothetical protein MSPP1_002971 [Malassezia sp. CBS 17886]